MFYISNEEPSFVLEVCQFTQIDLLSLKTSKLILLMHQISTVGCCFYFLPTALQVLTKSRAVTEIRNLLCDIASDSFHSKLMVPL